MAGGYQVGIASETKAFKQGIEVGVIEPVQDAQKELLELGRNRGPEQLEKSMKDAQRETKDLKDETKRTADAIEREYKDSYRAARQSAEAGLDGMQRNTEEVAGELRQNLGETFSSFRGDLEDLPQIAQDTLGGLAGSGALGGIPGLFATAAGAAGLGLLIGGIETLNKDAEAARQYANDLAQAYIDAGATVLDTITLSSRVADVLTDDDQRAKAQELVDLLGIELPEAARIIAGDTNALATAYKTLAGENAALQATRDDGRLLDEQEAAALADRQVQLDSVAEKLGALGAANEFAQQRAKDHSDALLGMIADAGTAQEEVDELGNKLYTLPDGHQIMIDAETGLATSNVETFKEDVDGIPRTVKTRAIVEAHVREAQNAINQFITRNEGKSFTLRGRVRVDSGGEWQ